MRVNSFFLLFILAHLTGDFVLQTDKIAKIKAEGIKGLIIHAGIITAVQIFALSFFGFNGVAAGAVCGLIHLFIDYIKNMLNKYFIGFQFLYFTFDQVIHIFILWLLTLGFSGEKELPSFLIPYVVQLIIIITLVYVSTVAVKILLMDIYPLLMESDFFMKFERGIDGLTSVVLGIFFIFSPWFVSVAIAALLLPVYFKVEKNRFNYGPRVLTIKYSVIVLFGLVSMLTGYLL